MPGMGSLTEVEFTELVGAGCPACGVKKLVIRSYVEGRFPIMGGEPVGPVTWAYKGETFVDGVFEVRCASCKNLAFSDPSCPRCHAPDGLARALENENAHPVPKECPTCQQGALTYRAFVPAIVTYEGKRADKARTHCELYDAGFHGVRAECKTCGVLPPRADGCPLCHASGPVRVQPG
jgi:hypothetical protein